MSGGWAPGDPPGAERHEDVERVVYSRDPVNPDHYKGEMETIDIIHAMLSSSEFDGFCKGNAIKYLSRAGQKGPALIDVKKAIWYLRKMVGEDPRS